MGTKKRLTRRLTTVVVTVIFVCISSASLVAGEIELSKGQTVYVPVYSNVIAGPREAPVPLSNTLTIRNTDLHNEILVSAANYYDTKGALIKKFYSQPIKLAPLETKYLYLSDCDEEGGVGANFVVRWHAAKEVNTPIIECVMVGSQGRGFVSSSQVVKEDTK